jgi:hypothetical protein
VLVVDSLLPPRIGRVACLLGPELAFAILALLDAVAAALLAWDIAPRELFAGIACIAIPTSTVAFALTFQHRGRWRCRWRSILGACFLRPVLAHPLFALLDAICTAELGRDIAPWHIARVVVAGPAIATVVLALADRCTHDDSQHWNATRSQMRDNLTICWRFLSRCFGIACLLGPEPALATFALLLGVFAALLGVDVAPRHLAVSFATGATIATVIDTCACSS